MAGSPHDLDHFFVRERAFVQSAGQIGHDAEEPIGHADLTEADGFGTGRHSDQVAAELVHHSDLGGCFISGSIQADIDRLGLHFQTEHIGSGLQVDPATERVRKIDVADLAVVHREVAKGEVQKIGAYGEAPYRPLAAQASDGGGGECGLCPAELGGPGDGPIVHFVGWILVSRPVSLHDHDPPSLVDAFGSSNQAEFGRNGHAGPAKGRQTFPNTGAADQDDITFPHDCDATRLLRPANFEPKLSDMSTLREARPNDLYELLDLAHSDGSVELEDYLQRVVEKALDWFSAQGISVFLRNGGTETFGLAVAHGLLSTVPNDAVISDGQGIAGVAIAEGQPRLLIDPTSDRDLARQGIERKETIGSSLIIPLMTRNAGCIGVMNVARAAESADFSESDLEAASSLGRQIALALSQYRTLVAAQTQKYELQSAMDLIGFGLLMIGPGGRFQDFTPEIATILESSPRNHLTVATYFQTINPNFQRPLNLGVERAKKNLSYRFRVDDPIRHVTYAAVTAPMQNGGVIVAIHDITEHEKARGAIDRIQRLAEIGQLTASIAHEIRNPLTGIQSAARMIVDDPMLAPEFGEIIEREAGKLNQLCTEFLTFAKPLSLDFEPIRLSDIGRRVVDSMKQEFHDERLRVEFRISPDEPILYADPVRVEQVFRNLLKNAIDASSAGQLICIEIDEQGIAKIRDQGIGMEPHIVDRLFTPFFTTKPNGTGLGLSICHKIMEAHRSTIRVNSVAGSGTTFELNFNVKGAA